MPHDPLRRIFADPENRFRFCPFWFLNHDLNGPELRWQLREMNRHGVGGAILHPRHGLLTPWMTPEWLDLMAECVDECKRQGMKAYLYDENNWPSGPADGQVFIGHPEFRMSHVVLTEQFPVRGGTRVRREVATADGGLIAAVAVPYSGDRPVGFPESAVLLNAYLDGNRLDWTAPPGNWRVFVFGRRWHRGTFYGSYVDTMNPEAIRRFLEIAYQPYADRFAEEFGGVIQGIFTDEPSMGAPCAWTPRMPAEFEIRAGYPLLPALPALFQDMGPRTARVRCDYFRTMTDLWCRAFMKQLSEFATSRGLNFMGHMLCDGELVSQVMCNGDYFQTVQYLSWGGLDYLTLGTWPSETTSGQLNNLAVCKFATSAADFFAKPVIFSECFGLAGAWSVSLRDLKTLTDFQAVCGVNLMAPHAFYYSIQGFRKFECPPGEFYQSPFWPYYRTLADYAGRLCAVLREGKHIADLALFYPNRSVWAEMTPAGEEQPWSPPRERGPQSLEINFNLAGAALLKVGYDFDIVSEDLLQSADFSEGLLTVAEGRMSFKALVLPACTCVSRATAEALLRLVEAGGKVLALGCLPTKSCEQGEDEYVAEIFRQIFGDDYDLAQQFWTAEKPLLSHQDLEAWTRGLAITCPVGTVTEDIAEPLYRALRSAFAPDLTILAEGRPVLDVAHYHYVREGQHFIYLVNTSRDRSHAFRLGLPFTGEVEIWDPESGETRPAPVVESSEASLEIPVNLPPVGSVLYVVDPGKACPSTPLIAADLRVERFDGRRAVGLAEQPGRYSVTVGSARAEPRQVTATVRNLPPVVELGDTWRFTTAKPNVLPLTDWQMQIDNRVVGPDSDYAGMRYTTTFQAEIVPQEARLLLDGIAGEKQWHRSFQRPYEFYLNGAAVEFAPGEYLDHYMYEAPVQHLLRVGVNRVEIRTKEALSEPAALRHPVQVIGRFALSEGHKPRLILEPGEISGPWDQAGYRYYSGVATYAQEFTLTRAHLNCRLFVEMDPPGDLVEVVVNGQSCGVRAWEPWQVEITAAAKVGRNLLELRIANSLQNLLVQQPKPSGLLGKVKVVAKREVEFAW